MKGTINTIWFSQNGELHDNILPNLASLQNDASRNKFEIVLWTNLSKVSEELAANIRAHGIIIKDYTQCKRSSLYPYVVHFLNQAYKADDVTAFALASDVLRMAILELAPANRYYMYFDANDITFKHLGSDLKQLDKKMELNGWGFSFFIEPIAARRQTIFHPRNDFLVALKTKNPEFFDDYIEGYGTHLKQIYKSYKKPLDDDEAQEYANAISMSTGPTMFPVAGPRGRIDLAFIRAVFNPDYKQFVSTTHAGQLFTYTRDASLGKSWLPQGEGLGEIKKFEALGIPMVLVPRTPQLSSSTAPTARAPQLTSITKLPDIALDDINADSTLFFFSNPRVSAAFYATTAVFLLVALLKAAKTCKEIHQHYSSGRFFRLSDESQRIPVVSEIENDISHGAS